MVKSPSFGIFPIPFPDENCYSILCRYAVRRGMLTCSQICIDLFGNTEPLAGYLFKPFRLRDVQRWFGSPLIPTMQRYGEHHSCYPFYTGFLTPAHAEKVSRCYIGSQLTSGQAKRINRECGFPKNHKRNLWYCPECAREDIIRHGETCWRRLPQMNGAIYCPAHRIKYHESGVSFRDINYQIIPATYALMHIPDPEQETGNIYSQQYLRLSEDIFWLLNKGFSISDSEWLTRSFFEMTGKPLQEHLLYDMSRNLKRDNRFEDYLATRIMKDSGKERIDLSVSRQIGSILSIEEAFGTMKEFHDT